MKKKILFYNKTKITQLAGKIFLWMNSTYQNKLKFFSENKLLKNIFPPHFSWNKGKGFQIWHFSLENLWKYMKKLMKILNKGLYVDVYQMLPLYLCTTRDTCLCDGLGVIKSTATSWDTPAVQVTRHSRHYRQRRGPTDIRFWFRGKESLAIYINCQAANLLLYPGHRIPDAPRVCVWLLLDAGRECGIELAPTDKVPVLKIPVMTHISGYKVGKFWFRKETG